jgi:Ras-related protein Rab-6A
VLFRMSDTTAAAQNYLLIKYKVVFLGDEAVGKTAILSRFTKDSFERDYQATVGSDLFSLTLQFKAVRMRLQLWDTAGQERFRSPSHVEEEAAAVIVYDVSNRASFDHTIQWVKDVRQIRGKDCVILLVANKTEIPLEERKVSREEGEARAQANNLVYMEVSAAAGYNIKHLFYTMAVHFIVGKETGGG